MALISMSKHCFFLTTYDAYILYYAHFLGLISCIKVKLFICLYGKSQFITTKRGIATIIQPSTITKSGQQTNLLTGCSCYPLVASHDLMEFPKLYFTDTLATLPLMLTNVLLPIYTKKVLLSLFSHKLIKNMLLDCNSFCPFFVFLALLFWLLILTFPHFPYERC